MRLALETRATDAVEMESAEEVRHPPKVPKSPTVGAPKNIIRCSTWEDALEDPPDPSHRTTVLHPVAPRVGCHVGGNARSLIIG